MSNIIKYSLNDPNADIMIIENGYINNNVISINEDMKNKVFLPTMYQSWTLPQKSHITFKIENTDNMVVNNDILYIFDMWGISSYYHLLIDHVIPLWMTKQYIENYLLEKNEHADNSQYLMISKNNYHSELSTCNDIFKHFLKQNYTEVVCGKYKYIIYGYAYTHRPFHGSNVIYYPNYQNTFNKFICEFNHGSLEKDKYIIIPERHGQYRNYGGIEELYRCLCNEYNVKKIDFGKYSIDEQIKLCSSAYAMIGSDGAAFANQIFMKKGSLVISICQSDRKNDVYFQSSLSKYMNHEFNYILYNHTTRIIDVNNLIMTNLQKYCANKPS